MNLLLLIFLLCSSTPVREQLLIFLNLSAVASDHFRVEIRLTWKVFERNEWIGSNVSWVHQHTSFSYLLIIKLYFKEKTFWLVLVILPVEKSIIKTLANRKYVCVWCVNWICIVKFHLCFWNSSTILFIISLLAIILNSFVYKHSSFRFLSAL